MAGRTVCFVARAAHDRNKQRHPHPDPLPWGEGATHTASQQNHARYFFEETHITFSLSLRERAGVRGKSASVWASFKN